MTASLPPPQKLQVLMIEDNPDHASLLVQLLSNSTQPLFGVTVAETLAQGLEKFRAANWDLVLLDLTLSDSQGLATFEKTIAAVGDVPIVVLSGTADVSVAVQTVQRGAQDYLVKGHVDNHLLLRSIQYAIERKQAQVALQRMNADLEERVELRTGELLRANERLQREVTERRKAEEMTLESNQQLKAALDELRTVQRDLIRRERFQALAQMANGIAHEFNNVLTPIVGFAEHLLKHPFLREAPNDVRQPIERIKAAALAGSKAVARVRDFSRAESGQMGPVAVGDLIENVITLTEPKWKDEALARGATISVAHLGTDAPDVVGDAAQLREALAHLIFNAAGAIHRRGFIRIGAEPRGDGLALFVEDDGQGMTEAQRLHCLDPKASSGALDQRLKGYAVLHSIISRHHGELQIESAEGKGTKVSIVLPTVIPAVEVPLPSPPPPPAQAGLRVLVADDEPMVQEVIRLYLQEDGHEVVTANDGGEALEKFKAGEFDLVLTDRAMPELSGDQLAAAVKELRPQVRVILLTGFGDLMNAEGERPRGVDAVVSKPFTMATLRKALAETKVR